jgi:hypothetical protein
VVSFTLGPLFLHFTELRLVPTRGLVTSENCRASDGSLYKQIHDFFVLKKVRYSKRSHGCSFMSYRNTCIIKRHFSSLLSVKTGSGTDFNVLRRQFSPLTGRTGERKIILLYFGSSSLFHILLRIICTEWVKLRRESLQGILFSLLLSKTCDRLCGLVVRVLGYRSGGPGSIPGTTRKKK